jgi:two-component system, cell cycle response regulator DivK
MPAFLPSSATSRSGSRGRGLVLIADDTFDTRELYEVYLTGRGFAVRTVVDGESALDTAATALPDVIVMDLSMPRLDGVTATRQLKQDPRTKGIPVIIWTAYPHKAVQQGALDAGADAFLTKPCLPEELEHHLSRLIAGTAPLA